MSILYNKLNYRHCSTRCNFCHCPDPNSPMTHYSLTNIIYLCPMSLKPDEEDLFNPDYVEVDRVLDVSITVDPFTEDEVTHYLVKWRGLPYEDSTWELPQDVDKLRIEAFFKFRELPSEEEREVGSILCSPPYCVDYSFSRRWEFFLLTFILYGSRDIPCSVLSSVWFALCGKQVRYAGLLPDGSIDLTELLDTSLVGVLSSLCRQ